MLRCLAALAMATNALAAPPAKLDGTWMLDPVATEKLILKAPPPPQARELAKALNVIGGYLCLMTYEFEGDRLVASAYQAHGRNEGKEYGLASEQGGARKYLRKGADASAGDGYSVSSVSDKHLRIARTDSMAPLWNLVVWQRSPTSTEKTPMADVMASCERWANLFQNIVKHFEAAPPEVDLEHPIELETPTGTIKGTLTMPPGAPWVPVVLVIAGSGPTDRDGNTPLASGRNDSLKMLTAALNEHGVASVRYDKRGVAASREAAREEADLRLETYVEDAASWIAQLSKDSRFSRVVVLGHSEGSLIGLLAAQRNPASAFISIAGPAERAATALRRQLKGRLPPELGARSEAILVSLEAGKTVGDVPSQLSALYRPSVQPYLISWFKYSPADEFAKLRVPCLIVQGGTDIQVEVADARKLHAANPKCALKVIAGMNHILKIVPAERDKQMASYGDPAIPLSTELAQALEQFFAARP
ncbi:alpha/beta hydrolase [Usitatibacter palustris]|uniref:alpha/beta hydrolase n=1 Tax=Usitatibacter palustris TaxID=2732487 RepID=UPI001BB1E8AD|nr:alpha/beta fold hydrolase [Usitatibacter palustris]